VLLRSSVQLRPQFNAGEKILITAALIKNNRAIAKTADVLVKVTCPKGGLGNLLT